MPSVHKDTDLSPSTIEIWHLPLLSVAVLDTVTKAATHEVIQQIYNGIPVRNVRSKIQGWRDGSAIKNTHCSRSRPVWFPAPTWQLTNVCHFSSRASECMWYTSTHAGTHPHK